MHQIRESANPSSITENFDNSKKTFITSKTKRLLAKMIIFSMVSKRMIFSDKMIQNIMHDPSLLDLVQRNWMGVKTIKSLLGDVLVNKGPLKNNLYGRTKMTDSEFLDFLKDSLYVETQKQLEIYDLSNYKILEMCRKMQTSFGSEGKINGLF